MSGKFPPRRRSETASRSQGAIRFLKGAASSLGRCSTLTGAVDPLQTKLARTSPGEVVSFRDVAGLSDLIRLLPDLAARDAVPRDRSVLEDARGQTFRALLRWLLVLAETRPVLVVLEDLHWSDDVSLDFLLRLARRAMSSPVFLIFTYRSDLVGPNLRHFLAELNRETAARELGVQPLDRTDVVAMLRAIYPKQSVRAGFVDSIYVLTDGNPFFIEEVLASLESEGTANSEHPSETRLDPDALRIPRSVEDAVLRRLAQVSPGSPRALTFAAVAC